MDSMPDFMKDFLNGFKKTKQQMIQDYINEKITKEELDKFMKGYENE